MDISPGNLGNALDADFADIQLTLDETLVNLSLIQRDDAALRNGIVHPDALSAETVALLGRWTLRGVWVTATVYSPLDFVTNSGIGYVALATHVSGTFATDLAAGKWTALSKVDALTSAFSLTLLDDTTASAWLTTLGVSAFAKTLLDDASAAAARATLGSSTVGDAVFVAASVTAARALIFDPIFDVKGDLVVATAADTAARKAVGTEGQVLAVQAAQADGLIWTDYTRENMLLNGNWLIDQINEGALYTVTGGGADVQTVDGWSGSAPVAPGVFKVRQLADPNNAALKCLEITCTTIDGAIAAADAYYIHTAIEGQDAAALMAGTASAAQITISFKFKSNVTGAYGISIANSALNRSYTGIFTVADANEAAYSLTLTLDTTGTWLYDTGAGLRLRICLAAGTNFQKAAGSWGADNMLTTSAQANFMSNVANIAYLKRVHLIPGSIALPFRPTDIQRELAKCQRYYFKTFNAGVAVAQNAGVNTGAFVYGVTVAGIITIRQDLRFAVPMRAVPTIIGYNPAAANASWRNQNLVADSGPLVSTTVGMSSANLVNTQVAGDALSNLMSVHVTANARLT